MHFFEKHKKLTSVLFAAAGAALMSLSGMTAKACCNVDYYCTQDAWLRSDCYYDDNIICSVPAGETIKVRDIVDGWGCTEYTTAEGMTVIGWTYLDNYQPVLLDESYQAIDTPSDIENSFEKEIIWTYLISEMNFSEAAASAAIVNMQFESGVNPTAQTIDTNGLTSYGICQWNGPRYEQLLEFCRVRDLHYWSVDAQVKFLQYELENTYRKQCEVMQSFGNSAQDAYDAGYYWAERFEVCSSVYWSERAAACLNYYLTYLA